MKAERRNMKNKLKVIFTPLVIISAFLFLASLVLYAVSSLSYGAADLINSTVSNFVRRVFSALYDFLPFSLFELLIILLPLILFLVIRRGIKSFATSDGRARFVSRLSAFLIMSA